VILFSIQSDDGNPSSVVGDLRDPIWIKLVTTGYRFGPANELMTQSVR
ncbi:hypothetical protein Tco_0638813, partial [Tanacetum coccineum]